MSELQQVDVVTLVEEFLAGAVVVEEEPETVSVEVPATRAEMARVRYLRELASGAGPLEMSPGAYLEAVQAGWLSPAAADALRGERDRAQGAVVELRAYVAGVEQDLQELRAWRREMVSRQERALDLLCRAGRCTPMCSPARDPLTRGIGVVREMNGGS